AFLVGATPAVRLCVCETEGADRDEVSVGLRAARFWLWAGRDVARTGVDAEYGDWAEDEDGDGSDVVEMAIGVAEEGLNWKSLSERATTTSSSSDMVVREKKMRGLMPAVVVLR